MKKKAKKHLADPADAPLEIGFKKGLVSITIGIDRLIACSRYEGLDEDLFIVDSDDAGRDIVRALTHEEEDGTTMVHEMLDRAVEEAVADGSVGIGTPGEED